MANETLNEIHFFLNNFITVTDFVKAFYGSAVRQAHGSPQASHVFPILHSAIPYYTIPHDS